jgi:hypothetical protein
MRFIEIWTTNAEKDMLKKLQNPMRLHSLSENDQFTIEGLIRKSLVIKVGEENPTVVAANEKEKKI